MATLRPLTCLNKISENKKLKNKVTHFDMVAGEIWIESLS
jgi:hypothetical protein